MKKILIALTMLGTFLNACKRDGDSEEMPQPIVNENINVVTNLDNPLILRLVNEKRIAGCTCGTTVMPPVPVVSWNNLLALAASTHSKDMNTNNFFAHESFDGKTNPAQRVTATGYSWQLLAENLASGQNDEQSVVNAWIANESQCKNIMKAGLKEMGVARDGIYWTQDLGTKRN